MNTTPTKTAIIYARVSSSGSQEQRQNTERQVKSLLDYAASNGLTVERIFEEPISGAQRNSARLGLQECLAYAKDNEIGVILFSELSRAGRQIWEILEAVKFCIDYKIDMFFQKEGLRLFDGDRVNGVMAIYISCLGFCAEKERENIAFRLSQGRLLAIEKGVKMGRPGGSVKTLDRLASEYAQVIRLLKRGQSVRNTAKICGVSTSTVQRIKKTFNI
jgi:DNA invertase Pin-like site-specific DNA recombinase